MSWLQFWSFVNDDIKYLIALAGLGGFGLTFAIRQRAKKTNESINRIEKKTDDITDHVINEHSKTSTPNLRDNIDVNESNRVSATSEIKKLITDLDKKTTDRLDNLTQTTMTNSKMTATILDMVTSANDRIDQIEKTQPNKTVRDIIDKKGSSK